LEREEISANNECRQSALDEDQREQSARISTKQPGGVAQVGQVTVQDEEKNQ
jgi:hypothetical protein